MIGAGFSRNAQADGPGASPFPLLEDYRAALAGSLNLELSEAARLPLDRLASEYEASFGREALNELITRLIPWRQYRPGPLHTLLLELPWADVFTTNYDPLLEDTRALVQDRKYELVLHPDDLPTATPPRIVKLHGSFPSTRPFVFTDEDFRRYPHQSAPFVNLVQQGMMEHTLCLLGFSGDDPNFLRWAGWVRDELGPHRPRIYLIGVLDLTDGRRRYLEHLGITPVDLAELFPWKPDQEGGQRHQQATEWLLRSLANGEPPDRQRWPRSPRPPAPHGLPHDPLPTRDPHPIPRLQAEENGRPNLESAVRHARAQRLAYPGWQVCPPEKRAYLHLGTAGRFGLGLIEDALEYPGPLDLLIAREGVWQLALRGEPLTPSGVEALDTILARTHPATPPPSGGARVTLPAAFSLTDRDEQLPWLEVKAAWVEVAFSQLTEAREDVAEARFLQWEGSLQPVVKGQPDWEARWHWEGVRWAITCLNREEALQRLSAWPQQPGDAFWEARRAAALAELGEIEAAQELNQHTLNRVRAAQTPGQPDYRLLSQEAWLMRQARLVGTERYQHWEKEESVNDRRLGRLNYLRQFECDPWGDIAELKMQTAQAFWTSKESQQEDTVERSFDVGRIRQVSSLGGGPSQMNSGPALALLRLCEWGASPLRSSDEQEWIAMLSPLLLSAPRLGVLTAVRVGAGRALNALLHRDAVTDLNPEDASTLIEMLIRALDGAVQEAKRVWEHIRQREHYFTYQILKHGMEALSRLMLRADHTQRQAVLDRIQRLAAVHAVQNDRDLYEPLGHLLHRTLRAMTERQRRTALPDLVSFPIPKGGRHVGDRWPDPFDEREFTLQKSKSPDSIPPGALHPLLAMAETASSGERRAALKRLSSLFQLGLMDTQDQQAFARTLWRKRDQHGLPGDTPFYTSAFLAFPAPPGVDPAALLKEQLIAGAFEPPDTQATTVVLGPGGPLGRAHSDLVSLKQAALPWTADDVSRLLARLQAWWPGMARVWQIAPRNFTDRNDAPLLVDVLQNVLLQHAGEHATAVEKFIGEVQEYFTAQGITVLTRDGGGQGAQAIIDALVSSIPEGVQAAIQRAVRLLSNALQQEVGSDEVFQSVWNALLARVIFRPDLQLESALEAVAYLVSMGWVLTSSQRHQVLLSLRHLAYDTALRPSVFSTTEQRSERGERRAAASALAAVLYQQAQPEPPDTLRNWAEIGQNDPLPEVRQPWFFLDPPGSQAGGEEK